MCSIVTVSLGVVGSAHAQTSERLVHQHSDNVRVVQRQVAAPAAVVSRDLEEQPVYTHLVELKVNNVTTYIDPKVDYVNRTGPGGLDRNHSIVRAQLVAPQESAKATHVVRGTGHDPRAAARVPQPVMIITKPKVDPAPQKADPNDKKVARLTPGH
jgi:hypothetical protein